MRSLLPSARAAWARSISRYDTVLGRQVAIKVLAERFGADPDRLARLDREARVLASLNHPNIATIYGLEPSAGWPALILELVEGPTLDDRLAADAIGLRDALGVARQIAGALEAAHEHGVIHRDLKPANIKIRPDGTVKVLDFGIAKVIDDAGRNAASISRRPSPRPRPVRVVGTPAYMSPEQACGAEVTRRSDVWAFGAVLYEMLTGKRAFNGPTRNDVLAAILHTHARLERAATVDAAGHCSARPALPRARSESPLARHWRCTPRNRGRRKGA